MTSPPSPYNITLSSDSPTINYIPYRDGLMDGGWNMTCSQSNDSAYIPQTFCVGAASRRSTFVGASMSINFEGTAAYVFGTGSQSSFTFQVDDQVRNDLLFSQPTSNGLLAKIEGLSYGQHTVYLNVTQSNLVSFYEAIVTIGVARTSSAVQNRTMVPFTQTDSSGDPTLNTQFIYTGSWYTDVPGTIGATGDVIYPRQHTYETGAYVTFQLSQTSAFFIYGLVNVDLGPFSVTLTPPPELQEPVFTGIYNSNSRYIDLDRVMFWTSGLDRDKTYSVKITNMGDGATPWWDFSHIDILDGGSNSLSILFGKPNLFVANDSYPYAVTRISPPSNQSHHTNVGVIAGAAAAGIVVIALLITGLVVLSKRKKTNRGNLGQRQSNIFQGPQMVSNYPQTMVPQPMAPAGPSIYPYVPSGYSPVPLVDPALAVPPGPSHPSLPYTPPQWPTMTSQANNSYVNVAPSTITAATSSSRPEGSSTLSYTKSGVLMTWNGDDHDSAGRGPGMGNPAHLVREEDAGSLSPPGGGGNVIRLPPDYKDAWGRDRLSPR